MGDKKVLISDNGTELTSKDEILGYLKETSKILKEIRQTPKFAADFREGKLDSYFELENMMKLSTDGTQKLSTEEVMDWIKENNIR